MIAPVPFACSERKRMPWYLVVIAFAICVQPRSTKTAQHAGKVSKRQFACTNYMIRHHGLSLIGDDDDAKYELESRHLVKAYPSQPSFLS